MRACWWWKDKGMRENTGWITGCVLFPFLGRLSVPHFFSNDFHELEDTALYASFIKINLCSVFFTYIDLFLVIFKIDILIYQKFDRLQLLLHILYLYVQCGRISKKYIIIWINNFVMLCVKINIHLNHYLKVHYLKCFFCFCFCYL